MTQFVSLTELGSFISTGTKLALPADYSGVSMAIVPHLLRNSPKDLHLVCVPTGGLQADILIGAGLVKTVETSAMSLGEAGTAPSFTRAVKAGTIQLRDATCPAIHAGLIAAQKGIPFHPIRGLIGSDVLHHRKDWKVIQNPFADTEDPIVAIPAIRPDVAVFHAPMADKDGNVWIGRRRELLPMAYASQVTLVTVERIVEGCFYDDETTAAGVLPNLYISAIAEAPKGAQPYGLWDHYPQDTKAMQDYAKQARSAEGFEEWINDRMNEARV